MNRTILCLLILFSTLIVKSQDKFQPGYIIKNNGDTLNGFIRVYDWEFNPNSISFKTNIENKIEKFDPTQIKEFKTGTYKFITATTKFETTNKKTRELTYDPELKIETRTVFLQCIYLGEKNLMYYADKSGVYNLFIGSTENPELLVYKRYVRKNISGNHPKDDINNKGLLRYYAVQSKKYVGQLYLYFNNDEILKPLIEKSSYKLNDIRKIFQKYYDIEFLHNYQFKAYPNKQAEVNFGLFTGYSSYSLDFSSERNYEYLSEMDFNDTFYYPFGITIDIVVPYFRNSVSFNNEISYLNYKKEGYYLEYFNDEKYNEYNFSISEKQITTSHLVKYRIPLGKINFFANAGFRFGFRYDLSTNLKKHSVFYSSESTINSNFFEKHSKVEFGTVLGAGIEWNKIGLEFRYFDGNGMSNFSTLSSNTKSNSIQLYYLF